eukprot:2888249-Pleurochrysis_carterae.AAC.12
MILSAIRSLGKPRMHGSIGSMLPTLRRSAAVSGSDSLNASACASDVLLWRMLLSQEPMSSNYPQRHGGRAAGRGTRSSATRRRRRVSNSCCRPRATAC